MAQGSSAGRVPFDVEIGLELDPVGWTPTIKENQDLLPPVEEEPQVDVSFDDYLVDPVYEDA